MKLKLFWIKYLLCILKFNVVHIPSANMKREGFMNYSVASHHRNEQEFWFHFWGAMMSSIFMHNWWNLYSKFSRDGWPLHKISVCLLNSINYYLCGTLKTWPSIMGKTKVTVTFEQQYSLFYDVIVSFLCFAANAWAETDKTLEQNHGSFNKLKDLTCIKNKQILLM